MILNRMLGAALLRADAYEDVEADRSATLQAFLIVILVAVAAGVGFSLSGEGDLVKGIISGIIRGVVSWAVWALSTMLVGTTILKTQETEADWGQLARTTGFAQTPGLLNVLIFIPVLGAILGILLIFWQIATMIIAVRQSLDYTSTLRAFFVILIALIPVLIVNAIIFAILF